MLSTFFVKAGLISSPPISDSSDKFGMSGRISDFFNESLSKFGYRRELFSYFDFLSSFLNSFGVLDRDWWSLNLITF